MKQNKIYIIAEIGVNHNGNVQHAKDLIRHCKRSGADAVKFQTYSSEDICDENARKANYQTKNKSNESQIEMLKKYELSHQDFRLLNKFAKIQKIDFITTISDINEIDFVTKDLRLKTIKVGSADLTNIQLLLHLGKTNKNIVLSTGMSDINKINIALSALAFGNNEKISNFSRKYYNYHTKNLKYINNKVTLLHCTTEYPAPLEELNLNVIDTFKSLYKMKIGYSDHSKELITASLVSAKNINVIEVHVTKSNKMNGPDHSSSLNIDTFKKYVQVIKKSEIALGSFKKHITNSEKKNQKQVVKRLFIRKDIDSGQILKDEYIACKRSNSGILASEYSNIINKKVNKSLKKGTRLVKQVLIK